jgi:hypothetical protein
MLITLPHPNPTAKSAAVPPPPQCTETHQNAAHFTQNPAFPLPTLTPPLRISRPSTRNHPPSPPAKPRQTTPRRARAKQTQPRMFHNVPPTTKCAKRTQTLTPAPRGDLATPPPGLPPNPNPPNHAKPRHHSKCAKQTQPIRNPQSSAQHSGLITILPPPIFARFDTPNPLR